MKAFLHKHFVNLLREISLCLVVRRKYLCLNLPFHRSWAGILPKFFCGKFQNWYCILRFFKTIIGCFVILSYILYDLYTITADAVGDVGTISLCEKSQQLQGCLQWPPHIFKLVNG